MMRTFQWARDHKERQSIYSCGETAIDWTNVILTGKRADRWCLGKQHVLRQRLAWARPTPAWSRRGNIITVVGYGNDEFDEEAN